MKINFLCLALHFLTEDNVTYLHVIKIIKFKFCIIFSYGPPTIKPLKQDCHFLVILHVLCILIFQ